MSFIHRDQSFQCEFQLFVLAYVLLECWEHLFSLRSKVQSCDSKFYPLFKGRGFKPHPILDEHGVKVIARSLPVPFNRWKSRLPNGIHKKYLLLLLIDFYALIRVLSCAAIFGILMLVTEINVITSKMQPTVDAHVVHVQRVSGYKKKRVLWISNQWGQQCQTILLHTSCRLTCPFEKLVWYLANGKDKPEKDSVANKTTDFCSFFK